MCLPFSTHEYYLCEASGYLLAWAFFNFVITGPHQIPQATVCYCREYVSTSFFHHFIRIRKRTEEGVNNIELLVLFSEFCYDCQQFRIFGERTKKHRWMCALVQKAVDNILTEFILIVRYHRHVAYPEISVLSIYLKQNFKSFWLTNYMHDRQDKIVHFILFFLYNCHNCICGWLAY